MGEIAKCPVCGNAPEFVPALGEEIRRCCGYACAGLERWTKYAAAMELAKAHVTLENAMEPLNSGKLKMGEAMPAIRLAMEDTRACEQRVMEHFI